MKPIIATIKGGIIRSISQIKALYKGGYKRRLFVDYGNQKYVIDEIVSDIREFRTLDVSQPHDFLIYLNGLEFNNDRANFFVLFKCQESELELA